MSTTTFCAVYRREMLRYTYNRRQTGHYTVAIPHFWVEHFQSRLLDDRTWFVRVLPFWQRSPVYLILQSHLYVVSSGSVKSSMHPPPFRHGLLSHGPATSDRHNITCNNKLSRPVLHTISRIQSLHDVQRCTS